MESQQPEPPQLKMRCNRLDALPPVELPPGYSLCTLLERDEADWIDALNATGQTDESTLLNQLIDRLESNPPSGQASTLSAALQELVGRE